jgi:hypothetical protein
MAAKKKATRGRKPKPQGDIAAAANVEKLQSILEAGELEIDKKKLKGFMDKQLKGIKSPKVRFVALNAPFMRQPRSPAV